MDDVKGFGVIDYCFFAGLLAISSGIGIYFSYKGNKSPEEFLMGNRTLRTFPVAMSLLTTFISATMLLGFTGEVYANGMQISVMALGGPLAIIFVSHLVLPVLYPLKLTSINEYIELRFNSKRLRLAIFFTTLMKSLIASGIGLYSPTLILASITKLDTLTNIFLLGIVCTIYSSFGGIRAVIWTDVFQLIIILLGLTTILSVGITQNGGLSETLYTASKGGRLEMFDMNLSPFVQYTFINTLAYGFFDGLRKYTLEQASFQRLYTVKSAKESRRVLKFNIYGNLIIFYLMLLGGIVAYSSFVGCDPMALGLIKKKDKIFPYFVMNRLNIFPGLSGLFAATIMGGALSTLSSMMNSCAALIWRDIFLKFKLFKTASPHFATLTSKIISLAVGAILIGIAIVVSNTSGLISFLMTVIGTFTGPALGVFLIGYFLPKCNLKGVWTGFISSSVLMLWLAVGRVFYKMPSKMLPFSANECQHSNITAINISRPEVYISSANSTTEETSVNTFSIISLYQISQALIGVFGPLLCVLVAIVVSCLTGNQKIEDVSPKLISPYVRRFYWTKEELDRLKAKEIELNNIKNGIREIDTESQTVGNQNFDGCQILSKSS